MKDTVLNKFYSTIPVLASPGKSKAGSHHLAFVFASLLAYEACCHGKRGSLVIYMRLLYTSAAEMSLISFSQ